MKNVIMRNEIMKNEFIRTEIMTNVTEPHNSGPWNYTRGVQLIRRKHSINSQNCLKI